MTHGEPAGPGNRAVTAGQRNLVYERDDHRCVKCQRTDELSIDHIWPQSKGGGNQLHNLQTLCRRCNERKDDKVLWSARNGNLRLKRA